MNWSTAFIYFKLAYSDERFKSKKKMSLSYSQPIHAVIFDNDGTILDTLQIYYDVLTHFADPPFSDDLIHKVNGVSDFEACKIFVEYFKMDMTPEELFDKRAKLLNELLPKAKLIPGVDNVINKLNEMKIPMVVATGSLTELHNVKASGHPEIFSVFKGTLCGDQVKQAKPSPEIFLKARELFLPNINPENILVIEDALNGIIASHYAGMPSVLVNNDNESFKERFESNNVHPTISVRSFSEFPYDKFKWEPL